MSFKVEFEFDPFEMAGVDPDKVKNKRELLKASADYALEQTLEHVARGESPVEGHGKFPALSPKYKAKKKASGRPGAPDLFFEGDMLPDLKTKTSDTVWIGHKNKKQAAKADGHNNHSGESELPLRRYVPDEGETFKKSIRQGIKRIIREGAKLLDEE